MDSLITTAAIAVAFFLGGTVKGGIGFGVPLVSLPLLATVVDVRTALALLTFPIVFSNGWQAWQGGAARAGRPRLRGLLIAMTVGCALGAGLIVWLEERFFFLALGLIVLGFVLTNVLAPAVAVPAERAAAVGTVAGFVGGVMGGLSTAFGPPVVMYLFALHLRHEVFVATIGLVYSYASVLLVVSYTAVGILTWPLAGLSLACVPPLAAGMVFGTRLTRFASQRTLRRVVLLFLFLIGLNLLRRGLL